MLSEVLYVLIIMAVMLALALALRFTSHRRFEQRAWGTGRSALSRSDRQEIRRAIRQGRPVGDQRLATPAVLYGEQVKSSNTWPNIYLGTPTPHWLYVVGRIMFPLIGAISIAEAVLSHDTEPWLRAIGAFAITGLYLPVSERRRMAQITKRERRLQTSVDANRLLAAKP
jgi:hypothetical protein